MANGKDNKVKNAQVINEENKSVEGKNTEKEKAVKKENIKKLKKNKLKLFSILEASFLAISIIGGIGFGYVLNNPVNYQAEYQDKTNFYQSNFDIDLVGPNIAQTNDIKALDYVEEVVNYRNAAFDLTINGVTATRDFKFFDDFELLNYTDFSEKRVISEQPLKDNSLLIDYTFSKKTGLQIGDTVNIFDKEYVVSRVYRANYDYVNGIGCIQSPNVSGDTNPTGCYIKTTDIDQLKTYLNDYKPLGTLIEKTEYQTEEEYQAYLDRFNSKDYSDMVKVSNGNQNELNEFYLPKINKGNTYVWIFTIVFAVLSCVIVILTLALNMKSIKKYIRDNGKKDIMKIYLGSSISFAILAFISLIVAVAIMIPSITTYITFGAVFASSAMFMIIPIVAILLATLINSIIIKRI